MIIQGVFSYDIENNDQIINTAEGGISRQRYPSENKQKAKNLIDIRGKYVYLFEQKENGS